MIYFLFVVFYYFCFYLFYIYISFFYFFKMIIDLINQKFLSKEEIFLLEDFKNNSVKAASDGIIFIIASSFVSISGIIFFEILRVYNDDFLERLGSVLCHSISSNFKHKDNIQSKIVEQLFNDDLDKLDNFED